MKNFLKLIKMFLILALIFLCFFIFVYRGKIKLYMSIGKKYINMQRNIPSDISIDDSNSMNTANLKDIIYKNTNNVPLTLDIYKSKKQLSKGSPVILYVHGGSWAYGNKEIPSALSPILDTFREEGFTIISIEYELMKPGVNFDKLVCDVKDSIRWIYKNKDTYNFNTKEIGILGISAGAHLSLLASYTDDGKFTDDKNFRSLSFKSKIYH